MFGSIINFKILSLRKALVYKSSNANLKCFLIIELKFLALAPTSSKGLIGLSTSSLQSGLLSFPNSGSPLKNKNPPDLIEIPTSLVLRL